MSRFYVILIFSISFIRYPIRIYKYLNEVIKYTSATSWTFISLRYKTITNFLEPIIIPPSGNHELMMFSRDKSVK